MVTQERGEAFGIDQAPDVLTVTELQQVLRCSRGKAYEIARSMPETIRIGAAMRVPKAAVKRLLGLDR